MFKKIFLIIALLVFAVSCNGKKPTSPSSNKTPVENPDDNGGNGDGGNGGDSGNGGDNGNNGGNGGVKPTENYVTVYTPNITVNGTTAKVWKIPTTSSDNTELTQEGKQLVDNIWKTIAINNNIAYSPLYMGKIGQPEELRGTFESDLSIKEKRGITKKYIGTAIVKVPDEPVDDYLLEGKYTVAGIYRTLLPLDVWEDSPHDTTQEILNKDQYLIYRIDRTWESLRGKNRIYYSAHFIYDDKNPQYQVLDNMKGKIDNRLESFNKKLLMQTGWTFILK